MAYSSIESILQMLDNNYSQQDINQALADLESMHSAGNINNSIYEDMKALLESKMNGRGVKTVRYADDIVVLAKSKRAAERLMESCRRFLEGRLKLRMNTEKSKAANLRKLGIPTDKACQWGNTRLGYWRIAGSPVLQSSITNERLATAGYFDILSCYESLHLCG